MHRPSCLVGAVALCAAGHAASADTIAGIDFPHGNASFADRVVSYTPGDNVSSPYNNPLNALDSPIDSVNELALGHGGSLVIEFVDNALVDQDAVEGGLDLWIFEIGPQVESFQVEISQDMSSWIDLGLVSGQPTGIDIKPFVNSGDEFHFVRITDGFSRRSGSPFAGADIDAIGAIGSIAVPVPTPSAALAGFGLLGITALKRRRAIA